jgi:cell division protein FtsW (lipid II flippase)
MKKLYFNLLTLITTSLLFPSSVLAQDVGDLGCNGGTGIATAIGCVSLQPSDFAGDILRFSVGIGGGIALLLLLYGFTLLTMSAGSPDKVNAAKEIITSAIGGLIFITMATVLMGFIGINILNLPGLN